MIHFSKIDPAVAAAMELVLPIPGIDGPTNEMGEPCPWPWDPIQLKGAPIGQYHCPYCGAMVLAGMDHLDYKDIEKKMAEYEAEQEQKLEG